MHSTRTTRLVGPRLPGWLLPCFLLLALARPAVASDVVQICEDAGGWPPFLYQPPGTPPPPPTGLSVDVANAVFTRLGQTFQITLMPWKRCLLEVERGEHFHMILNVSFNKERATKYHFSQAYYETTPYYFYDRKRHPDGFDIHGLRDLPRFRIGGILGYNYTYFGLTSEQVTTSGIYNLETLLLRLYSNQYDIALDNYEVVAGHFLLRNAMDEFAALGAAPVPGLPPTPFHMVFSRNEEGTRLYGQVDTVLTQLKQDGTLGDIIGNRLSINSRR